jgi:predicted enzyme related to lactoylglutathione lyase
MGGDQIGAAVIWLGVAGLDLDALRQFYSSLFGWRVEIDPAAPMPTACAHRRRGRYPRRRLRPRRAGGQLHLVRRGRRRPGAIGTQGESLGGKVAQPPTPLADGSRVAMVNDNARR